MPQFVKTTQAMVSDASDARGSWGCGWPAREPWAPDARWPTGRPTGRPVHSRTTWRITPSRNPDPRIRGLILHDGAVLHVNCGDGGMLGYRQAHATHQPQPSPPGPAPAVTSKPGPPPSRAGPARAGTGGGGRAGAFGELAGHDRRGHRCRAAGIAAVRRGALRKIVYGPVPGAAND